MNDQTETERPVPLATESALHNEEPATFMDETRPIDDQLMLVEEQFRFYGKQHRAKVEDESLPMERREEAKRKAEINEEMADHVLRIRQNLDVTSVEVPENFYADNYGVRDLAVALVKAIVAVRHVEAATAALFYGERKEVATEDVSDFLASGGTSGDFDFDYVTNTDLLFIMLDVVISGGKMAERTFKLLQGKLTVDPLSLEAVVAGGEADAMDVVAIGRERRVDEPASETVSTDVPLREG